MQLCTERRVTCNDGGRAAINADAVHLTVDLQLNSGVLRVMARELQINARRGMINGMCITFHIGGATLH